MAEQRFSIGQTVYVFFDGKRYEAKVISFHGPLDLYDLEIFYDGRKTLVTVGRRDIKA
jgi:hypothetical protein